MAMSFCALIALSVRFAASVHLRAAKQEPVEEPDPWVEKIAEYTQNIGFAEHSSVKVGDDVPSIFVTIISRVDGIERRALIRDMWTRAKDESGNASLSYKFAVCGANNEDRQHALMNFMAGHAAIPSDTAQTSDDAVTLDNINQSLYNELLHEQSVHNDVMYLNCEEGYGEGALTKKVLASMEYYMANTDSRYFMKIDDDSFLSWSRYAPLLHLQSETKNGLYMGILVGEAVPCREPTFRWYEPYENYAGALFPKGMSGGSGYTIDRKLVDIVTNSELGKNKILWNEDRAVGLWMNLINQSGVEVDYVNLKGVDGFWAWDWEHPKQNWKTFRDYKGMIVHHGLEGETIKCLAEVDALQKKDADKDRRIDECFESEEGKFYEPLKCAELNKDAMKKDPAQKASLNKAQEIQKDAMQFEKTQE